MKNSGFYIVVGIVFESKPFTSVKVIYGPPIMVPSRLAQDQFDVYRKQVQDSLENLERHASTIVSESVRKEILFSSP